MEGSLDGSLLADSTIHFTLDLYKYISRKHGNIFFSPFSISVALAMTVAGARNNTAEEMKNVMKLEGDDSAVHKSFKNLLENLMKIHSVKLFVANGVYVQNRFTILEEFKKNLEENYQSTSKQVDFQKEPEKVRMEINQWVEDLTQKKIKDLLAAGTLDEATRMVLINAIYFKGDWNVKFDVKDTSQQDFFVDESTRITVDLMFMRNDYYIGGNEELDCQILQLPYVGETLSMFIILPNQINGLKNLEERITLSALKEMTHRLWKSKTQVFLPKFKIENDFSLGETLSKMGMKDLFDERRADLSGITGYKDLFVSAVMHKAFLEVNEEGSEAAAATAVRIKKSKSFSPDVVFRVDHPFILFIQDNRSECILFWGRVMKPTQV